MTRQNGKTWRLNKTVNLSVLVQLAFLASLIRGKGVAYCAPTAAQISSGVWGVCAVLPPALVYQD